MPYVAKFGPSFMRASISNYHSVRSGYNGVQPTKCGRRRSMEGSSAKTAAKITSLAPQFLVDDLSQAVAYYRDRLGFASDFVYESFYASVSRDGFSIHLKCAPKNVAERTHRKQNEHLDAYIGVRDIEGLFDELKSKGANIIRSLEERPWGCKDFYVEDPEGYLLCFSEQMT
ncbi:MAG: hypothetical protein C5B55_12290 [Blastocatellia bacterium]|nr:MAG: hypothetical protein C5B55_12290 [Blastocatellia bacterium]